MLDRSWGTVLHDRRLHVLILALSILIGYFGTWDAYFRTHDDFEITGRILNNETILEAASGIGNKVAYLNFSMIWVKTRFFGMNPAPYYVVSLIQQIIVTYLVYWLAELVIRQRPLALLAAVIYATRSSYWEVVTMVSASDYSFWGIFWLLALTLFIANVQRRSRWSYLASIASFAFIAFGHDYTINLLPVMVAYYLILGRGDRPLRSLGWADVKLFLPYLVIWSVHMGLQFYFLFVGTSEAIYSNAPYGPGLHMIRNLFFLVYLIVPNIPIYDTLGRVAGGNLVAAIQAASAILSIILHIAAIYLFWKGSRVVRFSLAIIYLTFLQYTPWGGDFAGSPRYLYLATIGFSLLLALLLNQLYQYLQRRNVSLARLAVPGLIGVFVITGVLTNQIWIRRHLDNSQFRRAFVTQMAEQVPTIKAAAEVYIEVPEQKYTDLGYVCYMLYDPRPKCKAVITGESSRDDIISQAKANQKPIYWFRATDAGFEQVYPPA